MSTAGKANESDEDYALDDFEDDVTSPKAAADPSAAPGQGGHGAASRRGGGTGGGAHVASMQRAGSEDKSALVDDPRFTSPAPPTQALPVPHPHPKADGKVRPTGPSWNRHGSAQPGPTFPRTTMHRPVNNPQSDLRRYPAVGAPGPADSLPPRPFQPHPLHHYRISVDLRSIRDLPDLYNVYARYSYPAFGSHAPVSSHPPVEVRSHSRSELSLLTSSLSRQAVELHSCRVVEL